MLVFTATGCLHAAGDYAVAQGKFWWSAPFFLIQPIAFFSEMAVIATLARVGLKAQDYPLSSSLLGYVWVVSWFSYTLPMFMEKFWLYLIEDLIEPNQHFVRALLDSYRN